MIDMIYEYIAIFLLNEKGLVMLSFFFGIEFGVA